MDVLSILRTLQTPSKPSAVQNWKANQSCSLFRHAKGKPNNEVSEQFGGVFILSLLIMWLTTVSPPSGQWCSLKCRQETNLAADLNQGIAEKLRRDLCRECIVQGSPLPYYIFLLYSLYLGISLCARGVKSFLCDLYFGTLGTFSPEPVMNLWALGTFSPEPVMNLWALGTFSPQPVMNLWALGTFSPQPVMNLWALGTFSPQPVMNLLALGAFSPEPVLTTEDVFLFVTGVDIQEDSPDLEADAPGDPAVLPPETLPNEADFLMGYATLPGFVSYRSKTQGSWYITTLVRILDQYGHRWVMTYLVLSDFCKASHWKSCLEKNFLYQAKCKRMLKVEEVLKCVKSTPHVKENSFTCSFVINWIQKSCL